MHLSAQPAGALFFKPSVAVETRGLRTHALDSRSRAGRALEGLSGFGAANVSVQPSRTRLAGLGEGGAWDWIGTAATGVTGAIASIVGATSPEATAQAQANSAAAIAAANAQREAFLAQQASTDSMKTMVMVVGGVAVAGMLTYVFTRK